ncbi:MAG: thiamine phosphate synthase [Candidatus Omnitrophota bacterium]|nr:thiamine phosphate synthase [Candidatus Omnitrophota bacterium]
MRKFRSLMKSSVDAVQLRFKDLADLSVYRTAREMADLARKTKVPLIINDRPEMALSLGASGVHLGKSDISASTARKVLGPDAIIGCTVRGFRDLDSVDKKDVDYVAVGPVFRTPLKPGVRAISRPRLRDLCENAAIPLVAIGGINIRNVGKVVSEGVKTVAFVRYGIAEKDTRRKIEKLRQAMLAPQ